MPETLVQPTAGNPGGSDKPALLDQVLSMKPSSNVENLRKALLGFKPTASIKRARIETRVLKETEGQPMVLRRAKVFAAVVREMPIYIYPDELLVGGTEAQPRTVTVSPANAGVLKPERAQVFDAYMGRKSIETTLSEEDKRELIEELTPYWREHGLMGAAFHYGHNVHDFDKVVRKGFLGIKAEAEERLAGLDLNDPEDEKKVPFLEGVILAMEATAEFGARYAALARQLAEEEQDAKRKAELLKIAEACDWVPANPARNFHEAIQSYCFSWLLLFHEYPHDMGFSQGRMDQSLYPYYAADIQEGRCTKEEAQALLDCCILKTNFEGKVGSIGVGGLKPNGQDGTNEISYMFIEAMMHTRLVNPYFAVHIHSKTADDFLLKACQLTSLGTGHPQYINADVMVDQALARGSMGGHPITLEDARTAANVGCLELVIPGKDSGYLYTAGSNLALAMELVMTNGVRPSDGVQIGPETGDPKQFTSFREVKAAFRKQVGAMREKSQMHNNTNEKRIMEVAPTVFESALIENCIEKGFCREEGGALYNFNTGSVTSGSTDAGDSLAAIKKLVFDDKTLTMEQLGEAMAKNFEGHEEVRRMCLDAPKFGNDDDYVDEEVSWVLHQWVDEYTQIENLRGGHCCPGGSPMWNYVPLGKEVGALPSGRRAYEPLADAASPGAGKDLNGPTAVLASMGKIDHVEILGGIVLNIRMDPSVFENRGGLKRLADMMRTFIDQKIVHVQINVVSSDTLRAAQKDPEKYEDLVVKVAGYNAYFTHLDKALQDSIIARTSHGL